jgi:imidazole glycerol phosphate synthase subunit HisF
VWNNLSGIKGLVDRFGKQAIACSIDYKEIDGVRWIVTGNKRDRIVGRLDDYFEDLYDLKCGEIMFTNITRDGEGRGMDNDLSNLESFRIPIVLSGGYGLEEIPSNVDGVASTSALFLFGRLDAPLTIYPLSRRVGDS